MTERTNTTVDRLGACALCGNRSEVDTTHLPTTGKTFCLHCLKCYPTYIKRIVAAIDAGSVNPTFIGDGG